MNEAFSYAAHEDGKGTQGRMHVIGKDGFTLCGRLGSNDHGAYVKAQHVAAIERCRRPGCKQGWPDFRRAGDNTLMRFGSPASEIGWGPACSGGVGGKSHMTPKERVLQAYPNAVLWEWADGYCIYRHRTVNPTGSLGESGYATPQGAWYGAWLAVQDERKATRASGGTERG